MGADGMSSHSINPSEPTAGAGANAGSGIAGMPGSAASDATMPTRVGESGSACGRIEQQ
jgi:hypothetical protein